MQQLSPTLDILVVDDDRDLAEEFKEHLSEAGWKIEMVCSAQEALLMTGDLRPRLIIADIKMPGMNGIEMSQIIDRFADAPCVILMSGECRRKPTRAPVLVNQ
jgi:DNA-binding response OmpR family regulator